MSGSYYYRIVASVAATFGLTRFPVTKWLVSMQRTLTT